MADPTEDICATITKDQVEDILKNDYGFINGKIQELDGYDDKNYHITVRKDNQSSLFSGRTRYIPTKILFCASPIPSIKHCHVRTVHSRVVYTIPVTGMLAGGQWLLAFGNCQLELAVLRDELLEICDEESKKRKGKVWVKDWMDKRKCGASETIIIELRDNDPFEFKSMIWLTPTPEVLNGLKSCCSSYL
ncbi:hypothetical protein QTP88_022797 [Uroleucon formosanum]